MVKYSYDPSTVEKVAKSKVEGVRCHFKHACEVAGAIRGLPLAKAINYLERVLEFKAAIPFRIFTGGCGRHAQGKLLKAPGSKVRWPQKATKYVLSLLRNAEANAEMKSLDMDRLVVKHVQANQARKMRRRTYRAHGRINPYMACPAHIEEIGRASCRERV